MVVAAVVVVEHLGAGPGPVLAIDCRQSGPGALRPQAAADALGGLAQGLLAEGAVNRHQSLDALLQGAMDLNSDCRLHLAP